MRMARFISAMAVEKVERSNYLRECQFQVLKWFDDIKLLVIALIAQSAGSAYVAR